MNSEKQVKGAANVNTPGMSLTNLETSMQAQRCITKCAELAHGFSPQGAKGLQANLKKCTFKHRRK
jgi:hypothetical protein